MKTTPLLALAVVLGSAIATAAPAGKPSPSIDTRATTTLRQMTDFLAHQKNLSLRTRGVEELVTQDGQKLDLPYESRVWIQRPGKLRADRVGEGTERAFYYDGKTFTIYGKESNLYAQAPAPPTLDEAMDTARDRLGIEAPAADFFYTDAYEGLMEGVTSAIYVGDEVLDGVRVRHLAFRAKEVDWQVWIDTGARPLPRRYVITSKTEKGEPEFRVDMSDWDVKTPVATDRFAFKAPQGAQKISFANENQGVGGSGKEGVK